MKIYHNNRCKKSRETLKIIQEKGINIQIIEYLKDKLNVREVEEIIKKLGINPIDLVRKNELIWKENYKGKTLTDKEVIKILVNNPKLIQRPIVINSEKGVLGRPPEKVLSIIN